MNKTRTLALLLSAVMVFALLAACDPSSDPTTQPTTQPADNGTTAVTTTTEPPATPTTGPDGRTIKAEQELREMYSGEVDTMNYLISGSTNDLVIGANTIDSLVENDQYGNILPGSAESWEVSDDGLTWTFHLRPGQYWYDADGNQMEPVTAHDFVAAIRYVCDAGNDASNFYMVDGWLVGAAEYYAYTAAVLGGYQNDAGEYLEEDPAENPEAAVVPAAAVEDIGVVAVDDNTLQYNLVIPRPYFLTALQFGTYWPAPATLLESLGTNFALDNYSMWFNGSFILSQFEPQNVRVYTKNPGYWDIGNVHIEKITQRYNAEAATLTPTMYMRDEVDYATISSELLPEWRSDPEKSANLSPTRVTRDYNYFYCFNFEPQFGEEYEPDNWIKAVNNENFRQAIFHALDRVKAMEVIFPDRSADLIQNGVTPNAFSISENTGKDYTTYGDLAAIWARDSFDTAAALSFRDAARAELEAAGATFPIKVMFPYNSSMETWGQENVVIEQQLEALLGADFIDLEVVAGTSQGFLAAVRRSGDYALLKCNWGADYADPETWTDPFADGNSYNFAYDTTTKWEVNTKTDETMAIISEYLDLVAAAKLEYSDIEARYNAFAKAEAFYINHAMIIPYGITGGDYQATRLNTFESQYAPFGQASSRYKYQWVYEEGQSEAMFEESQAAWQAHLSGGN